MDVLAADLFGVPSWLWFAIVVAIFTLRPLLVITLPDSICGPGGWLIDTDPGRGWFGFSDSCGDGGGGD